MTSFEKALEKVLKYEGGYVNDSDDRGGETYKGISRNNFPDWEGWVVLDAVSKDLPLPKLLEDRLGGPVATFYLKNFWSKINLHKIESEEVASELFDTAVNMGVKRASIFLQRTVNLLNRDEQLVKNLKVDGVVGNETVWATNLLVSSEGWLIFVKVLNILQGARYIEIMSSNPVMEKYARGWLKRVNIGKEGV